MQLKLLNIHKLLSNIATNLVGAFIPVIVFEATGQLWIGVLSYIAQYLVRILFVWLCKNPMQNNPQIMLVVRIAPILLYSIFVIVIEHNVWVGAIGVILFSGINSAFKSIPTETIFNYSSLNDEGGGSLGFTRLIEQAGVFVSFVVGGYLLEWSKLFTVVISIVIYAGSVVPLIMYYIQGRKEKTFNKDATSNANITFKKDEKHFNYGKVLSKKLLLIYGATYFCYCLLDGFPNLFNIHLFALEGSYAITGIMTALYNLSYGIGNFIYGKIAEKRDIMTDVIVFCVVCAGCVGLLVFVDAIWVKYIAYIIMGFGYAPICLFNLQRLLSKSRILGVSNDALIVREQTSNLSVVVASLPGMFGTIMPCFMLIILSLLLSAWVIPIHEEKTRKLLVDYLQYNEIRSKTLRKAHKPRLKHGK